MNFIATLLSACALLNSTLAWGREVWPVMREFELSIGIRLDSDRIDIDVPFYDEKGEIRYRFICRGGNYDKYLAPRLKKFGANYLPPLTCFLNVGNRESGVSLLSEDESAAYFSRGRIGFKDIIGTCGVYPEYGLLRHFRLRGFELTLDFSDVTLSSGKRAVSSQPFPTVAYTVMKLSLRRDSTAKTAKSEPPGFLPPTRPGGSCDVIKKGTLPLMCRNPGTLAWEQCPVGWEYERYPWEDELPSR